MIFDDLNLNPELLESIDYMGFREATPIQEKAIPVILSGRDLIGCAQTGTGKTAAYLLPIMNSISEKRPVHTHTLVLVPTRELAIQIDQQVQGLAYTLNITSLAVYGGGDGTGWDQEKVALSKDIMKNPVEIALERSKPAEGVIQAVYMINDTQKLPLINSLIADHPEYTSILIFSSTKKKLSEIVRGLRSKDYHVEGISSDLGQKEREEMLLRFRSRKTRVLVATDVLSRGIDIKDINLVINFDAPSDAEDYVHRVGRTARAETTGAAITLVNRADMLKIQRIEKLIGNRIYNAPLPAFIAENHVSGPGHRPPLTKSRKNRFKRRFNQNGSRQKTIT